MANALSGLIQSRKSLIMILALVGSFVGVYMGRITWPQVQVFLTVTIPAWMIAMGIEDAAKKTADGKTEVAKLSLRPPPMSADVTVKSDA